MKTVIRKIMANMIALYAVALLIPSGFSLTGGFWSYLKVAVLMFVLKILVLPVKFLTMGLLNFFLGAFLFYLLTLIVPEIKISSQNYEFFSLEFSRFWVYFLASLTFSFVSRFVLWIYS